MGQIGVWEHAEPGVRRKIFAPGEHLMMMEVHFETGARGYMHSHPHEQMSYCVKGRIQFTVDGKVTELREGETIVIPGGAEHGVQAMEPTILLDTFTPLREDLLG